MPVVLLEKDPFVKGITAMSSFDYGIGGNSMVRRPLYGIAVKDPIFAYVSVMTSATGDHSLKPISIVDSSSPEGLSNANHNFILQSVSLSRQERTQIMETFGSPYIFFYGQTPQIIQVGGILLNTRDFNWKNEWLRNYEKYLRGSRCVEMRARVYMGFDDVLVSGYILSTSVQHRSESPNACPFNFQMLLTDYKDLSEGSTRYVQDSTDARTLGGDPNAHVEYVSPTPAPMLLGEIGEDGLWRQISRVSNAPGDFVLEEASAEKVPSDPTEGTIEDPSTDPAKSEESVLNNLVIFQAVTTDPTMSPTDAAVKLSEDPSSMSFTSRTAGRDLSQGLGAGVGNFCGVVD